MGAQESLTGVSVTAVGVARARARESGRTDRLFDDPYAQAFADAFSELGHEHDGVRSIRAQLGFHIVIRTRFYDDHLLAAGCRQVVLLAAGLDTRAFRLPWPEGTRLYEVDLPQVIEAKERVLAARSAVPNCARATLGTDLLGDWPARLSAAGFDPAEPTAWLVEGLLVYLTAEQAAGLLAKVTEFSADGSTLAAEQGGEGFVRLTEAAVKAGYPVGTLWRRGIPDGTGSWLAEHGWSTEVHALAEVAAGYGRPPSRASSSAFVTATRVC